MLPGKLFLRIGVVGETERNGDISYQDIDEQRQSIIPQWTREIQARNSKW